MGTEMRVSVSGSATSSSQRRSLAHTSTGGRSASVSSRHRLNANSGQIRMTSTRAIRSRRKVIRLLVAVVVSFALCVLPHHIRLLLNYWKGTSFINGGVFPPLSFLILYLNSALNPVLICILFSKL